MGQRVKLYKRYKYMFILQNLKELTQWAKSPKKQSVGVYLDCFFLAILSTEIMRYQNRYLHLTN